METKMSYTPPKSEMLVIVVEGVVCGSPTGSGEDRDEWED